jgi:ribA/ribD-fused uncharacterized protein
MPLQANDLVHAPMDWTWNGQTRSDCAIVFRTDERFGGLSNMSNEFPLQVNGTRIGSTEALYQACRYPHQPEWQREIIAAPHAMRARMVAKKGARRQHSRPDWDEVKVDIMRWCLRLKLEQHFGRFFRLLKSTGERPIVERSRRDRFWGAVPSQDGVLEGQNMLGQLLVQLRDETNTWMAGSDGGQMK